MSGIARRPVVCVLDEIHPVAIRRLAAGADVVAPADGAATRWVEEADAVIVRHSLVPGEAIARARRLRVIGKHGAGTDNIDAKAAAAAGVAVHTTPGLNAESVADLAVGMALALVRDIHGHTQALKRGEPLRGAARVGYEIAELPVGVGGFGTIGRAVARRLRLGFGAAISAYDPGVPAAAWPEEIRRFEDVGALLRESRLVFLHLPLVEATRGLIGAQALASMPQGAFLVNCARGGIVDEAALAAALHAGHLGGAASDVFEVEPPPPDNPLLAVPGFLATPHLGASTNAGLERVGLSIVEKVLASLEGAGAWRPAADRNDKRG
jgi:D-3-phosphoglycerate dehydrogenase